MSEYHVIPEGDIMEHEGHEACWCEPILEYHRGKPAVFIHRFVREERH